MKFSISWLKEHLDTTASVDEIAETLTKIGLEVEEVFNPASRLDGFVTAEVETYERHPDSDHLGLLTVNTGKEKLQVVCGAPNCKQGLKGIFAPVGVVIPCYNEELKVGKIRGVESFGICRPLYQKRQQQGRNAEVDERPSDGNRAASDFAVG